MRQGQQHRRGRNRSTSSGTSSGGGSHGQHQRKLQNPLARSFESNGPDVKVRGTAADIASKYLALARDAQSVGDPVLAENYMQHAEHYTRMINSYREQQAQPVHDAANGAAHRARHLHVSEPRESEEGPETDAAVDPGLADQPVITPTSRAQPTVESAQPRIESSRPERIDRGAERRPAYRPEYRPERGPEKNGESQRFRDRRYDRSEGRSERPEQGSESRRGREPLTEQPQPLVDALPVIDRDQPLPRRRDRFVGDEQPEFLRRPVKRPRQEDPISPRASEVNGDHEPQRSTGPGEKAAE